MDEEEEEGRWWWWWTSARKQESFPVGNGALLRRDAAAMPPPSVAHYCTWIAHTTHTKKNTHCWQCGPFAVHRLSPCLCLSCDPPLLLLLLHSHHQLVGHTHFHAHTWSSSDVRGAVIYGARSLSVYAGNSNTHGRTAGKERRGEEGAPGCSPLLTFTFLSNAHTYFLHFFFSLFSCLFLTNFFLKCMCNGGGGCT